MGKINLNMIWMCECNPIAILCLFSSGFFTSPVCVWVHELSHAAHPLGNTATWLVCLWASSSSSQMCTTPSHSIAPPAGSYYSRSAAWILYTRAFWRKGQLGGLGRGRVGNAGGPVSRHSPFCGTDFLVCPLPGPPESPSLRPGQNHAPQIGTGTHQCQTSLLLETASHMASEWCDHHLLSE